MSDDEEIEIPSASFASQMTLENIKKTPEYIKLFQKIKKAISENKTSIKFDSKLPNLLIDHLNDLGYIVEYDINFLSTDIIWDEMF
jgi:hypothetical protein